MKQKQIILQNNIIDIYQKVLKSDKEKSLFLLKIFKFLLENEENFKANDKINGIFLAIKPSLKIKEFDTNWGGKREGSGRKINGLDNSSFNQDENQDENQDFSSSFKDIKNKSNKDNKDNKDIKKENIKEKKELDLSFIENENYKNLVQDWLDYKKQKKSNYTQKGIEIFYKRLLNLSNNSYDLAVKIIENSIANNYSGIFELKNNNYTKNNSINYCSDKNCPY